MKKGVLAVALVICLFSGGGGAAVDNEALRERMRTHPVRSMEYWGMEWRDVPLVERVSAAPPKVVEYLELDNQLYGFEEGVASAPPLQEMKLALEDILGSLPKRLSKLLRTSLTGVFTVNGLGSSGYIEDIRDNEGRLQAVFLVVDSDVFHGRAANAWATWREGSFFTPPKLGDASLEMRIEDSDEDNTVNAMRYILLHELGHCLGMVTNVHPSWNADSVDDLEKYPFVRLSWSVEQGKYKRRYDSDFPYRMRLYAFDQSTFAPEDLGRVYEAWAGHTNAPSLYATVSPFEDFAESFAIYEHAVREGRPWSIMVKTSGEAGREYVSCLMSGTCPKKKAFMEDWFRE